MPKFKVRDYLADQTLDDDTIDRVVGHQLINVSLRIGYYNRLGLHRGLDAKIDVQILLRDKAFVAKLREIVLDSTVVVDDWEWGRVCGKLAPAQTVDDLLHIAEDQYVTEIDVRRYAALYFDLSSRTRTSEPKT